MSAFNPIGNKPWSEAEYRRNYIQHIAEEFMSHARYSVIKETSEAITIRDDGPWERHPTITNDAEWVVAQVAPSLQGRRLFYIDSEGETDELMVRAGKFAGFAPGQLR